MGDEGGFAPNLASARDALDFIMRSVEQAGYRPGDDVVLALDCAATEFFRDGAYHMEGEGRTLSPDEMAGYLAELARDYPIRSIEDGMARGRSRRLEGADRRGSAARSSWSATICSSPIRSGCGWGSSRGWPTRS